MSKFVKQTLAKELENRLAGIAEFLVVDMTGVDGVTNNLLRGKLSQKGIKMIMVKNAMMRQAVKAMGMDGAADLFDSGPCTVAYGADNAVELAKELKEAAGKLVINYRGAYVDGVNLNAAEAAQLVNMKTRAELQGEVIMLIKSPGSRVAASIAAPGGIIAGCIKSLVEKLEKEAA